MCAIKETIDWSHYALISLAASQLSQSILRQETIKEPFLLPLSVCPAFLSFSSIDLSFSTFPSTSSIIPQPNPSQPISRVFYFFLYLNVHMRMRRTLTPVAVSDTSCLETASSNTFNPPLCLRLYPAPLPLRTPHTTTLLPPLCSAKPGSVRRKQLSPASARLPLARCILGTERCVTVDMWLTLYEVPLQ